MRHPARRYQPSTSPLNFGLLGWRALRQRTGLHLPHQAAARHLHGRLGDADIIGNLPAEATARDLNHDLAVTIANFMTPGLMTSRRCASVTCATRNAPWPARSSAKRAARERREARAFPASQNIPCSASRYSPLH